MFRGPGLRFLDLEFLRGDHATRRQIAQARGLTLGLGQRRFGAVLFRLGAAQCRARRFERRLRFGAGPGVQKRSRLRPHASDRRPRGTGSAGSEVVRVRAEAAPLLDARTRAEAQAALESARAALGRAQAEEHRAEAALTQSQR